MEEKIAIIDLGSNSIRLVIYKIYSDGFYRVINEAKEMVRLSENMGTDGLIKPDALLRTLKAVKLFKKICDENDIKDTIAVATAAVRNAKNKEEVLTLLKEQTGISFNVISGEMEAEYGYKGVINTMNVQNGYIIDVGGASTEISRFINRELIESISLPYGALNLTEMFLDKDISTTKQVNALEIFILEQLRSITWLKTEGRLSVIGLGGTIRSIGKIAEAKKNYSFNMVHNYRMERKAVEALYGDMQQKKLKERYYIPGMVKERADIIVAGACIINMFLNVLKAESLIISGSSIRDGIFFNYYLNKQAKARINSVSDFSIANLLKHYNIDMIHVKQVKKLAFRLYDQLYSLHNLPDEYRGILEKACLLHNIGASIDFYNQDMHTFYLITHSRINGLSHRQIILIAMAASKLIGEKLRIHYSQYKDILSLEDYKYIKRLTLLMILGDRLDYGKTSAIEDVTCITRKDTVFLETAKIGDGELEVAETAKLQQQFEKIFNKTMQVI